jgi:hypothetical protein
MLIKFLKKTIRLLDFLSKNDSFYEEVAELFHLKYEELAPSFGYKTRDASAVPWKNVPENNKKLMIETVKKVFSEI